MVLESALGDKLVKNDGTELKTSELSTERGGVIGLFFSAHWFGPDVSWTRGFTPKLATVYNEIKAEGKNFEIVFVSWDADDPADEWAFKVIFVSWSYTGCINVEIAGRHLFSFIFSFPLP